MKLVILSRQPRSYSTRRLREAARGRGHQVQVLDTLQFSIQLERGEPQLYFRNKRFSAPDAVVPRIGSSITFYGAAIVRQFEQMGVFCLNPSQAITVSRDKLRAHQILSRHQVSFPASAFVRSRDGILPAIQRIGGAPVIIKLLEGTQGVGVILAETEKMAQAIIETLQSTKQQVLVQKFVAESKGRDIRAIVIGDRVVAAMRRSAKGDEFRSNVHRGGTTEAVELDEEFQRTAVHAAQIMGLHAAGVDMLEGNDGPEVMEVNSSPGLEGIEKVTRIDVADAIVQHVEQQVLFPEVDIRQRLTLKAGYAVAEIPVTEYSELAHQTLRESNLRDRDILVLNILRGSVSIPNPRGDREILPGDTLICFGKNITLAGLMPTKRKKRKTKKLKP